MSKIDKSLTEAIQCLTVGEIRTIERHYGKSLDGGQISGTDLSAALVWAYERRQALADNLPVLPDWSSFDSWTLRDLNGYFEDEETEIDPSEPETDRGKDNSPVS